MRLPSNLRAGLIALVVVIGVGATGFVVIGDFDPGEALYVTVITITTVGYSEIGGPFDGGTRLWVVIVLLSGMGAAIYTATSVVEFGLETVFGSDYRKRRKMTKEISNMRDHVIVCGFGRVGSTAWHALQRDDVDSVVIEADAVTIESALAAGALVVEGRRNQGPGSEGSGRRARQGRYSRRRVGKRQRRDHPFGKVASSKPPRGGQSSGPRN